MSYLRKLVQLGMLLSFALSASAGEPLRAQTPYRIGVLYWSMNIPGQVAMRGGLEAEAARINIDAGLLGERGVSLIKRVAGDGVEGIERQIAQMNELVSEGVDLIIVQPTDNAALARPLQAANRAAIPVIAYDQYISGGDLASYITSDNYRAGYLDGEYVASRFSPDHTLRTILIEYPHVSSTVERVDGFLDALKGRGQRYRILDSYNAVEPQSGREAGEALLRDYPEPGSVDVVFAVNDGGGLSVIDALREAGRNEIVVATVDGDPRSVRGIGEEPMVRVDAAQFCGPMGEIAMRTAYRLLQGEEVAVHILLPAFPVSAETRHLFTSWHGPIPARFDKPWPSEQPRWDNRLQQHR